MKDVLFGTGVVGIPAVMKELRAQNFKGLVAIEYEKECDVDAGMEWQIRYARRLAA